MFCGWISTCLAVLPSRGDICLHSMHLFEFGSILDRRLWKLRKMTERDDANLLHTFRIVSAY